MSFFLLFAHPVVFFRCWKGCLVAAFCPNLLLPSPWGPIRWRHRWTRAWSAHYWQVQLAPYLSLGAYQMETLLDLGMVGTLLAGTVSSLPVPGGLSDGETARPRHGQHTPGRYS